MTPQSLVRHDKTPPIGRPPHVQSPPWLKRLLLLAALQGVVGGEAHVGAGATISG